MLSDKAIGYGLIQGVQSLAEVRAGGVLALKQLHAHGLDGVLQVRVGADAGAPGHGGNRGLEGLNGAVQVQLLNLLLAQVADQGVVECEVAV